jgi:group II intron reverse transcriptase/maturase/CRISPR-associated endonuclease Cas1
VPVLSETLTVLGSGLDAPALILREALRFKTRSGSLIIQDTTGKGAAILSPGNKMGLDRRRVIWVDLADRRRPVSLFQIRRSAHMRAIWTRVLKLLSVIAKANIPDDVVNWAAEAAYSLSTDGSVGLGALFRCLSSSETRHLFLETRIEPSGLGKIIDLLTWALSFPGVHGISEGDNRGNILDALSKPSVLWIESAAEHFEPKEHLLVQVLLEAALEDALRTMGAAPDRFHDIIKGLTVLHLYPEPSVTLPIESWVETHLGLVRHVSVHHLAFGSSLSPQALSWAQRSETLWLTGQKMEIDPKYHSSWISEIEAARIKTLVRGEIWIRSNRSSKALVARSRERASDLALGVRLRANAARRRRITSTDQIAASIKSLASPPGAHRDLYEKICDTETLRSGWFRVQESRSRAVGVDGISTTAFGTDIERELNTLSEELRSGRYTPRPLRRIQIPKSDGGVRNLGVACARDRVVQAACLSVLEPVFEPTFSRFSYGFRPHRNAHQAVAVARSIVASGRQWAVIADIRKCFDNIDHDVLLSTLGVRIADEEFLTLIRNWLTVDISELGDMFPNEIGVPQGESLSPLLANIYLDTLDKHFEMLGIPFVRYADDFVMFAHSKEAAEDICRRLADFLHDILRLELKPAKTFYVHISEGYDFLGFHVANSSIIVQPARIEVLLQLISALIKELAASVGALDRVSQCLTRFNSITRGWRNYFLLPGEQSLSTQMRDLDDRIEQLASIHLPDSLRQNPAWVCRERVSVSPPRTDQVTGSQPTSKALQPASGYPQDVPYNVPPAWMRRSSESSDTDSPNVEQVRVGAVTSSGVSGKVSPFLSTMLEDGDRLYVLTHGAYLTAEDEDVVLKRRRQEVYRRPMNQISLIYLQGFGINISVDAQVKLAKHDVSVVIAPPLGNPIAVINPIETARSSIRRLQVLRRDEPDVLKVGLSMIAAKASNQAAVLKYFAKYRSRVAPEIANGMRDSADKILELSRNISRLDTREASVRGVGMGLEGRGAAIYWSQLACLVPEDIGFDGRMTLSAHDPVNQCLNYVYGILYGEVWRAISKVGLDPYFGLIHGSLRDQGSLVFDLIEEFRAPFGDRVVFGMLGRGFRPGIGKNGLLRSSTKHALAQSFSKRWTKPMYYRSRLLAPVNLLATQAKSLAGAFQRENVYHPYRMRW